MKRGLAKTKAALLAGAAAVGLLGSGVPAASAQDVQQLEAQMRTMQVQMKELQRQVQEAKSAAASAQSRSSENLDLKVKWKGAPELSSSDGKFKFKVRGRLNVDYNGIDQDEQVTGDPDVSAVELRRARIGVEGVVFYDVAYKFEVDFAGDGTSVKDAYLQYTGLPVNITVGNFKPYNSLEEMMSANYLTFMERAAFVEAFDLDRLIGAGLSYDQNKHWTLAAGIFATSPESDQTTFYDDGTTFSSRVTVAPINEERRVVHLGASVRHRDAVGDPRDGVTENLFRYRARGADLHLADRFIATPFIGESDTFWGLEGAVVLGSFSLQGEYSQNQVDVASAIANADPVYDGWYIDASYFLTGESRPYKDGVFGRVKVNNPVFEGSGGWGAWQIAARYDVLDLSDQAAAITAGGVVTCATCGEQKTWLLGVNWHLNDYTRLMLNVNQSEIDGGLNDGAEITGVGMRAQVDW
ncbi:porin [Methyloceanibacter sp.]|uniref:OprO/OprP family phosphate-selective porin n=1 Tax=Methyloceanibacter sp. TaxID=1965321 RepID=UPI002CDA545B|nr:porin [Methyloceanibacter sp.]HML91066.1 porin [Methyloceanibacter sp.]